MQRIPNQHPNPTESSTFLHYHLKSDHSGFTDLEIVVSVQFIYCLYNCFHE